MSANNWRDCPKCGAKSDMKDITIKCSSLSKNCNSNDKGICKMIKGKCVFQIIKQIKETK
jgi:hypothetical protein